MKKSNTKRVGGGFWSARIKSSGHAERIALDPAVIYEDLLPDLREYSDGFAWASCPIHDDNNPSLCVNLESGWYKCHSSGCGVTGSNIVGFVGALLGYEYREAREYLEQHYG